MTVSEFLRQGDDCEWVPDAGVTWIECVRQGLMLSDCVWQGDDRD